MIKMGQVVLKHSYSEGNAIVHLMTKKESRQSNTNNLLCFNKPHNFVESRMLEDKKCGVVVRKMSFTVCKNLVSFGNIDALNSICGKANMAFNGSV